MRTLYLISLLVVAACSGANQQPPPGGTGGGSAGDGGSMPCFTEIAALRADEPQLQPSFGARIAVDGDTGAFGTPSSDLAGKDSGAVYLFSRASDGTWTQTARLLGEGEGDNFGSAVALKADFLVVGAHKEDGGPNDPLQGAGAVYVFQNGTQGWTQVAVLHASDAASADAFGQAVALESGTLFVGARERAEQAGAVYVFQQDAMGKWSETTILRPSDVVADDRFGWSVAASGNTLFAGLGHDTALTGDEVAPHGAVYVFERDGTGAWTQTAKLTASDPEEGAQFGTVLALEGSTALIGAGAHSGPSGQKQAGTVYVFTRDASGWKETGRLSPAELEAFDFFGGNAVALSGNRALVSATLDDGVDNALLGSGVVYSFERDASGKWSQAGRHYSSKIGTLHAFGHGLALSGNVALMSTPSQGEIFVFECR